MLKRLQRKHQDLYTHKNVMISGTHTHSAPGGYLMDFLFDASTLGFVPETFNALVKGITLVRFYSFFVLPLQLPIFFSKEL